MAYVDRMSNSARSIEVIGPGVFHRFNAGELHSTPIRTIYRFTPGKFTTLFRACHPEIRAGVTALPPFVGILCRSMPTRYRQRRYGECSCVKMRCNARLINRFTVMKINYVQDSRRERSAGLDEANVRIIRPAQFRSAGFIIMRVWPSVTPRNYTIKFRECNYY